jgi:hypothetical protein
MARDKKNTNLIRVYIGLFAKFGGLIQGSFLFWRTSVWTKWIDQMNLINYSV